MIWKAFFFLNKTSDCVSCPCILPQLLQPSLQGGSHPGSVYGRWEASHLRHYTEINTEGHWFPARGTFCQRRGIQKQRSQNPTWNSYLPFIICFLPTLYSVLFAGSLKGKLFWWSSKHVAPGLPGLLLWELSQIICPFRLFSLFSSWQWQSRRTSAAMN